MRSAADSATRSLPLRWATIAVRIVTGVIIACALVTAAGLAFAHARGNQVLTVVSGSMTPTFRAGDAVIVAPPGRQPLRPGQIIAFHEGAGSGLTTHRIVRVDQRADGVYVQTKGDANAAPDATLTPASAVVGVLKERLSRAGYWLALYQSPQGRLLFVALPLLALAGSQLNSMRRRRVPAPAEKAAASGVTVATLVIVGAITLSGTAALHDSTAVYAAVAPVPTNQFSTGSFCGSPSSYASVISADSPLIWYRFDETGGRTAVNAVSGANGRYRGATGLGQPGAIRCSTATAAGFDGSTSYVSNPTLRTGPGTFSIEVWFRTSSFQGGRLIGFGSSPTGASAQSDRQLYLDDAGHVVFGVAPAAKVTVVSPGTYNDDRWHLADATLGAGGMSLYVDGVAVGSASSTTTGGSYSGYWRVGYDDVSGWGATTPTRFHFNGTLDEAAVYASELSAAQVAAHFAANHA